MDTIPNGYSEQPETPPIFHRSPSPTINKHCVFSNYIFLSGIFLLSSIKCVFPAAVPCGNYWRSWHDAEQSPSAALWGAELSNTGIFLFVAFRKPFLQGSQAITMNKEHLNFIQTRARHLVVLTMTLAGVQSEGWGNLHFKFGMRDTTNWWWFLICFHLQELFVRPFGTQHL